MKRFLSKLIIIAMLFTISSCGKKDDDPNVGTWNAATITMAGEVREIKDMFFVGISLELKSNGKLDLDRDGEKDKGAWTFNNGLLNLEGAKESHTGNITDGLLQLVNVEGMNIEIIFEKEGSDVLAARPKPMEESTSNNTLSNIQKWWGGEWYGYWHTHSETSDYTDFQGGRWECFGYIDMESDDIGDIYLWDPEGDFAVANISISKDGGAGEMGAAFSNNGELWFGGKIENADWIIDPSIYGYDNYMIIDGRYTDNLGGGFNYIVYLRPWGESWKDNKEDERPLWYDTWYLSAYQAATMWEAIEDRDAHIHTRINQNEIVDAGKPSSTEVVIADIKNITGTVIDPGNITILCPQGWTNFFIPDYISGSDKNPNGLELYKGNEAEGYQYLMPGLEIQYYEFNPDTPSDKFAGKSEVWGPVQIGGRTWQGYIGTDRNEASIWAQAKEKDSQIRVQIMFEAEGVEISLNDAEVQAILASIKIK